MANCAFGLNNLLKGASLTGSASYYGLPQFAVSQVATDQGNNTAAFWSVGDTNKTAWFQAQWPAAQQIQAFFVGRSNLGQGATWQITASNGGAQVYSAGGSFATLSGVGPAQLVHVAPNPITVDTVKISVTSNGTVTESYIAISLAYVGPIWQPVRNMSTKSTTGMDTGQTVNTGMAGAEFISPGWMRRKAVVDHESLDLADVPVLEQIAYMAASGTNVLFIPDPAADPPTLNMRALYGRIQSGDLSNPYGAALRQQTTFTITERL
ncbi:hypothetical protein [Acetobacter orleanensis]|uniref:Uncharacterized protein n=1 Tax=Acetobacter orleanensis TaxID=104099 RepID=A0A4Y3TPY9_9PROT|nr:hypothetical protein [Acetobacter orleanensis]KXV62540.1 hypothetical protein AD949_10505 [Acetobacter orleanensis]PCD80023.1 hypothetical protein CO710_03975 [Acetobacter orleanensis]GAN68338.1 hypothetical protein Abol_015_177 [Acetobacter orleanensis JCM 7639]GBR29794.1 hypothetical protein AA0473_2110 [Acetobacter orleanensis NRIC 0473]GEB83848.1 hypothetical protein AOR01nite_23250 [Acetobacter orleanensis]